jgi:serine/threonine protein kinase
MNYPSQPTSLELAPGTMVARTYEIRSLIGQGGMGRVYEAFDKDLLRTVAIKVSGAPSSSLSSVHEEARALAAISNPCVVTVHGVGKHQGHDFIVMERVYGLSLEQRLEEQRIRGEQMEVPAAVELLAAIADGLGVVHQAGIVHWDLKPGNVMLAPGGRVVLLDFGVFIPFFAAANAPMFRGTPAYSSPEATQSKVAPDEAHLVDVYALGILGWELLTGAPPFLGPTVEAIWKDHERTPLPPLRTRRPDAPPALAELLAEMTAKQPGDRPPQMSEVSRRLRALSAPGNQGREKRAPRILIVEDEVSTQKVLDFFVRKVAPRAEIRIASRSDEALKILRSYAPDLILLDQKLPDGTGLDLCLHMRSLGLAERCRIVPVSATPDQIDRRLQLQLGLTQTVQKGPGALDQIGALVRETARLLGLAL